jgi:lysozyme
MGMPTLAGIANPALIIDLSQVQANANLDAAKAAGVCAVFLKATEGATFQDAAFRTLHDKAVTAGLNIGAYHFGTARPPSEQVDNFVATVIRIAGSFSNIVPVLDLEHNDHSPDNTISPSLGEEWVRQFKARTGRAPLLYAGGFLRDQGGATGHTSLAACPLWLADYESTPHAIPGCAEWTFWQFTDGTLGPFPGTVPGVGRCDQNIFKGDADAVKAFWVAQAPP